jgi:hypothetical protein
VRIVGGDERIRRILRDPRQDLLTSGEELRERADAEGVTAVSAVRRPFLHLLRIQGRLRPAHRRSHQAGRFLCHRIARRRIGKVRMKGQPQTGTRPGRSTARHDLRLVEIPFPGLAAHKLQRPRRIMQRCLHGRHHITGELRVTIVDRNHRNPCLQVRSHPDPGLVAIPPASPMNEEQQRPRPLALGLPEIKDLTLVLSILHIRRRRCRIHRRLLRRFSRRLLASGLLPRPGSGLTGRLRISRNHFRGTHRDRTPEGKTHNSSSRNHESHALPMTAFDDSVNSASTGILTDPAGTRPLVRAEPPVRSATP